MQQSYVPLIDDIVHILDYSRSKIFSISFILLKFYAVFHINPLVTNKAYCQAYSFFGGGGGVLTSKLIASVTLAIMIRRN